MSQAREDCEYIQQIRGMLVTEKREWHDAIYQYLAANPQYHIVLMGWYTRLPLLMASLRTYRPQVILVDYDTQGFSRRAVEAILAGDLSPQDTAELARGKLRQKLPQLIEALEGRVTDHHQFVLRMHLEHLAYLQQAIVELHGRIEEKLQPYWQQVQLVKSLPGVDTLTAQHAFVEMGADISLFPSESHYASWIGICPGNHESGGRQKSGRTPKGNRWLCDLLVQAGLGAGRSKGTYTSSFYHRLARRRGKLRAAVATGHHLARAMYWVLREGKPYQDLGADYFDRRSHDTLKTHLIRRLQGLGYRVELMPETAVA